MSYLKLFIHKILDAALKSYGQMKFCFIIGLYRWNMYIFMFSCKLVKSHKALFAWQVTYTGDLPESLVSQLNQVASQHPNHHFSSTGIGNHQISNKLAIMRQISQMMTMMVPTSLYCPRGYQHSNTACTPCCKPLSILSVCSMCHSIATRFLDGVQWSSSSKQWEATDSIDCSGGFWEMWVYGKMRSTWQERHKEPSETTDRRSFLYVSSE